MKLKHLLNEPTQQPVERDKSVNWFNITLIKVGIFISLPGFVTGVKIGNAVGFYNSIYAFLIGGMILGFIASLTGSIGAKTRLSTYVITQYSFGTKGALFINLIFAICLLGWFGINTALFGEAVLNSISGYENDDFKLTLYSIIGGLLMIATAIFGFKALDKLSQIAVPLLIIALFILVYTSITKLGINTIIAPRTETMSIGKSISAVVGGAVVGTVIFPDICRYAHSFKHGIIAAILTFSIFKPLILMSSAIPSLATGYSDIMEILLSLNLGVMALGLVVFTTWTSNNGNLYGASLSLSTLFRQFKYWQLVLITGSLGTILAISGIMEHFIPFLHVLGICLPPVAGIYITHYFVINKCNYTDLKLSTNNPISYYALISWFVACVVGFCSLNNYIIISTVPAIDAILTSSILIYLFHSIKSWKGEYFYD